MEFEHEPTDDQLDQLLRDVEIPVNLISQLKQIPIQPELDDSQTPPGIVRPEKLEKPNTSWMKFVLAASLIGIGLFVAIQFWPTNQDGGMPIEGIANIVEPKIGIGVKSPELVELEAEMADFLDEQESLEAAIHEIQVTQMKAQLARIEDQAEFQLDQREVESMIAAMSEQYAIPLGVPEDEIRTTMAQIIEKYPGTRGAKISYQFLNQAAN